MEPTVLVLGVIAIYFEIRWFNRDWLGYRNWWRHPFEW